MAISFPAAEVAARHQLERAADEPELGASQLTHAGQILRRAYERVCSAVFDPDGDCMRF